MVKKRCEGRCGKTKNVKKGEFWICEQCERRAWDESEGSMCPWGWCDGDWDAHHMLCLASKGEYGISWGHTLSHRKLLEMFGKDIWKRNKKGQITGLKA